MDTNTLQDKQQIDQLNSNLDKNINQTQNQNQNQTQTDSQTIYIRAIDDIEIDVCNFWLSFYERGTLSPQTLLDIVSVEEALDKAVITGVCDEGPLMLTDSSFNPPKFLYLIPMPADLQDMSWIDKISTTIASLGVSTIGLRLQDPKLDISQAKELLYSVTSCLVEKTNVKTYYLLTKDRGINPLLNVILSLKHSSKKNITILH